MGEPLQCGRGHEADLADEPHRPSQWVRNTKPVWLDRSLRHDPNRLGLRFPRVLNTWSKAHWAFDERALTHRRIGQAVACLTVRTVPPGATWRGCNFRLNSSRNGEAVYPSQVQYSTRGGSLQHRRGLTGQVDTSRPPIPTHLWPQANWRKKAAQLKYHPCRIGSPLDDLTDWTKYSRELP